MKYTAQAITVHGDEMYQLKFVVRGPSQGFSGYGRVFTYVLNDAGGIRVFDTEGQAWEYASAINRGKTPNV